jgi:hydrogenase/urease accessory protein HupE
MIASRLAGCVLMAWLAFAGGIALAHEVRPAYLQVSEAGSDTYDLLFKTPMRGEYRLGLDVSFSGEIAIAEPIVSRVVDGAMLQTWRIQAIEPLAGQEIHIHGLENTLTDALVRIEFADGRTWVQRLTPAQPQALIPAAPNPWQVAKTYLLLGIEHILIGIDHLLFVLGVLLLARGVRPVIGAITAFTVAHSVTLAASTLGVVHISSKPVEAAIALSIVFVAVEAINARAGRVGLAARMPWLVAFGFGLLHGFGFAGALSEIGMPEGQIPAALVFFNVGVEVGQLLFIAAVLALGTLAQARRMPLPRWAALAPPYLIGCLAMSWMI